MERNGRVWAASILCMATVLCSFAWGKYGGGSGTATDPYLIYTPEQLNSIGADTRDWDKCFRLMADLDLSGYKGSTFQIIGLNWKGAFRGVFDGNGKTISNFTYTRTDGTGSVGLFGFVYEPGVIRNLGLIDPNVSAPNSDWVGALIGDCKATVSGCYVRNAVVVGRKCVGSLFGCCCTLTTDCNATGRVTGSGDVVGGLAGYMWGTLERCWATATVTGNESVGGLVGVCYESPSACHSGGTVAGVRTVGGFAGSCDVTISDCYSTATVSADSQVGGLVGCTSWASTVTNCYSTGKVTGRLQAGGLIGLDCARLTGMPSAIRQCFWDTHTSGRTTSDGGTGLDTALMQKAGTFAVAGWDLVGETANGVKDIWVVRAKDYPRLWWEPVPATEPDEPAEPVLGKDDFEDGKAEPQWQPFEPSAAELCVQEANGRLELNAPGEPAGTYAFYVSKGWTIDPTQDFSMKVDFHFSEKTAGEAYVMMRLVPDPNAPLSQYVDMAAGCQDGGLIYTGRQAVAGSWGSWVAARAAASGTLYLSYDAQNNLLYRSFVGYGAKNAWRTSTAVFQQQWGGKPLHVLLGGNSNGTTLSSGDAWLDNFVVDTGAILE